MSDGQEHGSQPEGAPGPLWPEGGVSRAVPLGGRLTAALEVAACSGFPTQIVIGAVLALAGIRAYDEQRHLSPLFVVVVTLLDTAAIIALVAWFLRTRGERFGDVMLGSRAVARESWLGLLQVPLVFLVAAAVLTSIQRIAPWLHNVPVNPLEGLIGAGAESWAFVLVAVLGGGVREEIQRAFILHRFRRDLGGAWVGLAVFTPLFGLGHVAQGWDAAVAVAVLGLLWGIVYIRRGSIASTVVSHSGFNAAQVIRYTLYCA